MLERVRPNVRRLPRNEALGYWSCSYLLVTRKCLLQKLVDGCLNVTPTVLKSFNGT